MNRAEWDCPPLQVDDLVRVLYADVGVVECGIWRVKKISPYAYDCEVVQAPPNGGFLVGSSWGLFPQSTSGWLWRMAEGPTTETHIRVETKKPLGSTCRRPNCPEPFNPDAEPTRLSDRSHVCWSCRADGWGTKWGDNRKDEVHE